MAAGDIVVFNSALEYMLDGGWEAADVIKMALLNDAGLDPAQADVDPELLDYTEVTAGGIYSAGGETLNTWTLCCTQSSNVMTFDDTDATMSWAAQASSPTDCRWGYIYNDTQTGDPGIAYLDLGSVINLVTTTLTVTWNASGIFTITN